MVDKSNAKVKEEKSTRAETRVLNDEIGRSAKLGWESSRQSGQGTKLKVHVTLLRSMCCTLPGTLKVDLK